MMSASALGCACALGFGTRAIWTPAYPPSLAAWYEAIDQDARLVKAAQPTIVNGEFDSDTVWSKQTGWAIPVGGKAVFTAGAVGKLLYKSGVGIVRNRYTMDWYLSSGTCRPYLFGTIGSGAQTVSGMYSEEETALSTAIGLQSDAGDGAVDYIRNVINLSRTRWNPTAGSLGGYLSQVTANLQPYWDGSGLLIPMGRKILHSGAATVWNFLHTGGTLFIAFIPRQTGAATDWSITGVGGGNGGIYTLITPSDKIRTIVYNAGGSIADVTTSNAFTQNSVSIFAMRIQAGELRTWLNGATVSGVPSAALGGDALLPMGFGYGGASFNFTGLEWFAYSSAMPDTEVGVAGQYLAAKHGGTWTP